MGVSKNRATPKWMVYFMVPNPIKMDDLGVFPYFWKHPDVVTTRFLGFSLKLSHLSPMKFLDKSNEITYLSNSPKTRESFHGF